MRAFNGEAARAVLDHAGFGPGREVLGFTKGNFSFVDLIEAVLAVTGPADLLVSTWAASVTDLGRIALFQDQGQVRIAQFLIDGAFESYNKPAARDLRERFGDDNIRVIPNHAKFAMIGNDRFRIVVQTSMNLNQNRRLESFTVTDDAVLYREFDLLIVEIWKLQRPGDGFGNGGFRRSSETLGALGEGKSTGLYAVTDGRSLL